MANIQEDKLLKALSEMETIAKGASDGMSGKGNDTPTTTAQANGGLSDEGDKSELAVKGNEEDDFESFDDVQIEKGAKKGKTLLDWAKEESEEEAHKAMPAEEEEEDDEEEEEDESMDKSTISDLIKSSGEMGPVLDVAPFLGQLIDQVSDSDHDLRKSVEAFKRDQVSFNEGLQKSVIALGNLAIESAKENRELKEKIQQLLDLPSGERRSVLSKADINERFDTGPTFAKSDVLDVMVNLAQEGKVTPIDVSRYESTNTMEPHVQEVVEKKLAKAGA